MATRLDVIGAGRLQTDPALQERISADIPRIFSRGSPMGQHLRVERLVRVSEGRLLYLVNNLDPKWANRKCWACGNAYSPKPASHCVYCGTPLSDKRFLMSTRWDQRFFQTFTKLYRLPYSHPGMVLPVQVFRYKESLLVFFEYEGERLLVDSCSPLPSNGLLIFAHRMAGLLEYLHQSGVVLGPFAPHNFLVSAEGSVRMFDIDVVRVLDGPIPPNRDPRYPPVRDLVNLARLIHPLVHPDHIELREFFDRAVRGAFPTPAAFRDAIEQYADRLSKFEATDRVAAYTDVGLARNLNEDTWRWTRVSPRVRLFVVADGMGGHEAGEVASHLAADTVVTAVAHALASAEPTEETVRGALTRAFEGANRAVRDEGKRRKVDMGTTLVAMVEVDRRKAWFANVGDSRAYLLRNDRLEPITSDHSLVGVMVEQGKISREEARTHPRSNVITNTIGSDPSDLDIDLFTRDIFEGDRFLLCSDGLWGEVEEPVIANMLMTYPDPRQAIRRMVKTAYLNGGGDNTTCVVVDGP